MNKLFLVIISLVCAAAALPAQQANAIDASRSFTCPSRVLAFCRARNVHSGCTFNGSFRSDAMETCRECHCG
ncbi:hypothetical protein GQ602_006345 [Ophiocordyceps camponoti-floridani]|uniref:Uncharacterized protein n=1 Tax=Ophiocordyceps camponoti-floridani TaxID=2030778 RepID=A0A8H4Q2Z3_9HYPO|nr:hypothetical protein GQ602_006345 [Ophiocordyceps camponoti-floridani]